MKHVRILTLIQIPFYAFYLKITPSAIFQVIRKCIQNSNLDIRKLLVRVIFYEKIKKLILTLWPDLSDSFLEQKSTGEKYFHAYKVWLLYCFVMPQS